jgi:hypothetical protein
MIHHTYAWQEPYMAAILETDDAKMPAHILEATAAIEQRLLSPIESGFHEDRQIQNAQEGLQILKAERWSAPKSKTGAVAILLRCDPDKAYERAPHRISAAKPAGHGNLLQASIRSL